MNVSAPYEVLVPTLDGPVLTTLARLNGPVTGRQVHRLAGVGSEAGVRNVLNRLVDQGVVRADQAGNAWLYAINRDHVAWHVISGLANLRGELLNRLRDEFAGWDPRPWCAALYGSAARGDGDASSDIDILLVRTSGMAGDDESWQHQLDRLRELVPAWTGNRCQIYDFGSDEFREYVRAGESIVAQWMSDAVPLSGADVRLVLRDLGASRQPRTEAGT